MTTLLKYQLDAATSYEDGDPIIIEFTLENISSNDIWFLSWYTPFEGIEGKILEVHCDGIEIPYEGRMIKRGDPTRDDYLHLPARSSVHATFDLSITYSLRECRECIVNFKGRIHDVTLDEQQIPRTLNEHLPLNIPGEPVSFSILHKQ